MNISKRLKWGCGTLLVFGGLLLGTWGLREHRVNQLLQAQRDEAKRLGISLNPADYNKTTFPDSENAALRYEAILQQLRGREAASERVLSAFRDHRPVTDADLQSRMAPLKREVPLLLAASKLPHYRWKRPYEQGFDLLLPELGEMRALGAVLVAESRLAVSRGDKARAVEYAIGAIRFGRHQRQEPLLIGQILADYQLTMAMWHAAKAMAFFDDPAVTKTLMAEIDAVERLRPEVWIGTELISYDRIAKNPGLISDNYFRGVEADPVTKYLFRMPTIRREGSAIAMRNGLGLVRDVRTTDDPRKWNLMMTDWNRKRYAASSSATNPSEKLAETLNPQIPGVYYGRTELVQRMIHILFGRLEPAIDPRTGSSFSVTRDAKGIEVVVEEPIPTTFGPPMGSPKREVVRVIRRGRELRRFVNGTETLNWRWGTLYSR